MPPEVKMLSISHVSMESKVKSEAGECEVLINTPRIRLGEYLSPVR